MKSHVVKGKNGDERITKTSQDLVLLQAQVKEGNKIFRYFKHLAGLV